MLRYWIRILHLPTLVASTFTFVLGTAIADYLGQILDGWSAALGILTIWCMLCGSSILFEYLNRVSVGAAPFKAETESGDPFGSRAPDRFHYPDDTGGGIRIRNIAERA